MSKAALKRELDELLSGALAAARAAHASATAGATDSEAKPENDKDTRALEQSYIARGQAQRVVELEAALAQVRALELRRFTATSAIAMSALVTVDEDGTELTLFLAPSGGGSVLKGNTQVITPSSPIGRALLGKRVDDEVELQLPGRVRRLVVMAVG
jgi:transcription elongation GreA/GreB family factor